MSNLTGLATHRYSQVLIGNDSRRGLDWVRGFHSAGNVERTWAWQRAWIQGLLPSESTTSFRGALQGQEAGPLTPQVIHRQESLARSVHKKNDTSPPCQLYITNTRDMNSALVTLCTLLTHIISRRRID